jgi:hypothetical protein
MPTATHHCPVNDASRSDSSTSSSRSDGSGAPPVEPSIASCQPCAATTRCPAHSPASPPCSPSSASLAASARGEADLPESTHSQSIVSCLERAVRRIKDMYIASTHQRRAHKEASCSIPSSTWASSQTRSRPTTTSSKEQAIRHGSDGGQGCTVPKWAKMMRRQMKSQPRRRPSASVKRMGSRSGWTWLGCRVARGRWSVRQQRRLVVERHGAVVASLIQKQTRRVRQMWPEDDR